MNVYIIRPQKSLSNVHADCVSGGVFEIDVVDCYAVRPGIGERIRMIGTRVRVSDIKIYAIVETLAKWASVPGATDRATHGSLPFAMGSRKNKLDI